MLISSTTRAVLMYGSLGIAAVGLLVVIARRGTWLRMPEAPAARRLRRELATWLPIAALPLGLGAGCWAYRHQTPVVLVSGGAGEPHVERVVASSVDTPIAPGAWSELPNTFFDPTYVVNESARDVRVEAVDYGDYGAGSEPVVLPPGTAGVFYRIDHIGPGDKPPDRVIGSRLLGEHRTWLTWDRAR